MPTTMRASELRTSKDLPLLRRTTAVASSDGKVVIRHLSEEVVLELTGEATSAWLADPNAR